MYFWALAKLVPIALTLPGIAGLILTIGVAADASVVIFERVREEARAGTTCPDRDPQRLQARHRPRSSTRTSSRWSPPAIIFLFCDGRTARLRVHPDPGRAAVALHGDHRDPGCASGCWSRPSSSRTSGSWACTPARSSGSSTSSANGSSGSAISFVPMFLGHARHRLPRARAGTRLQERHRGEVACSRSRAPTRTASVTASRTLGYNDAEHPEVHDPGHGGKDVTGFKIRPRP